MKKKIFSALFALALVLGLSLGLVIAPMAETAQATGTTGQTLNVAEWTGPTDTGLDGRETVLYDGANYHMWYSSSDEKTLYHASSTSPNSFTENTTCGFGTADADKPVEVGSVTVLEEGGTFYMIAYGATNKVFNIYTSTDGINWENKGLVFDGTTAFTELITDGINKIDGPYLFKDDGKYRLYFQEKTPAENPTRYDIYTAESTATSLAAIAETGDTVVDFTLANGDQPVLPPGTPFTWDSASVMQPWVVKDGDVYYMWYSASGVFPQSIGFAYSTDGYTWTKSRGSHPIMESATGYAEPSVIIDDDGTWQMWYIGTGGTINYLTANGPFEFSSIQSAVNDASAGDTVKVAAGEYTEQVVIDKNLTLQGAGASSTTIVAPVSPDSLESSTFPESGSFLWEPVVFAFGGTIRTNDGGDINISGTGTITVTISGFTIDGNDRVPTGRSAGILLRNASGVISNNTVQNMYIGDKETFGILVYGDSDITIAGNNVSGYARGGIVASGDDGANPDPNAIITGNTVTGPGMGASVTNAPSGIQIGYGATGKIIGNNVSGNGYPGSGWLGTGILVAMSNNVEVNGNTIEENETGIGSSGEVNRTWIRDNMVDGNTYGISIEDKAVNTMIETNTIMNSSYDGIDICNFYDDPPTGTTIRGNTITANNTENDETSGGIWVDDGVDGDEVSIHLNKIVDNNGFGVINDSETGTIGATFNWWGDASGPHHATLNPDGTGDAVSANVLFDPWLGMTPVVAIEEGGGTEVISADLAISFPAGVTATDEDGNPISVIEVTKLDLEGEDTPAPPAPAPPAGADILLAYDFGPDGAHFNPAIELVFTYDEADIPAGVNETDLVVAYYTGTGWEIIEDRIVDTANNKITAYVDHFTTFGLIALPPATVTTTVTVPTPVPGGETTVTVTRSSTVTQTQTQTGVTVTQTQPPTTLTQLSTITQTVDGAVITQTQIQTQVSTAISTVPTTKTTTSTITQTVTDNVTDWTLTAVLAVVGVLFGALIVAIVARRTQ